MGPLSEESGDSAETKGECEDGFASMGPLSEESGDQPVYKDSAASNKLLQWGRSPKRAETSCC